MLHQCCVLFSPGIAAVQRRPQPGPHLPTAAHGGPLPGPLPSPAVPPQVHDNLQHFLRSSISRRAFTPLPLPHAPLPLPDALRIRDRGTILARHLHADAGDAFADLQVCGIHTQHA